MTMVYSHRTKLCDSYRDYDPYNLAKQASESEIPVSQNYNSYKVSDSQQHSYSQEFSFEQNVNGYDQRSDPLLVSDTQPTYDLTNSYQNSDSYPNYDQTLETQHLQSESQYDMTSEYSQNSGLNKASNSQRYDSHSNDEEVSYNEKQIFLEQLAPALLKALEQYRNTVPRIRRPQATQSHQSITKEFYQRSTDQSQSLTTSNQNHLDQHQAFDAHLMWTKALDHASPHRRRLSSSAIRSSTSYQMQNNSYLNPNAFDGSQTWSKAGFQRKKRLDRHRVYDSSKINSSQQNFNAHPKGSSYDFFDANATQQQHFDNQPALNQPIQMARKPNSVRINGSSFQNYDPYNLQDKIPVPKKYDPYNLDSAQQTTAVPFQNDPSYEEKLNDYSDEDDIYDEEEVS